MSIKKNRPIGVFDSGLGGLTVVNEIRRLLPHEDIVYFGDSARLPYGTKSKQQIIQFSIANAQFLTKMKIKSLVIACNSSSANAYAVLKRELGIPIIDVIKPVAKKATEITNNKRIGVIGTRATVNSNAYEKEIIKLNKQMKVYSVACPLFVPLVEEGWLATDVTRLVVKKHLETILKQKIDVLILGCTHYPLLKKTIAEVVGDSISIIDSGPSCAEILKNILIKNNTINENKQKGALQIYVSDLSPQFIKIGERFLNQKFPKVHVVQI